MHTYTTYLDDEGVNVSVSQNKGCANFAQAYVDKFALASDIKNISSSFLQTVQKPSIATGTRYARAACQAAPFIYLPGNILLSA